MKVFLSWSGNKSKHVAVALRDWLQNVIQAIDPWMSAEDMAKGSRWSAEIAAQLNDTAVGIICITPENQEAPWLNFEAGALAKAVKQQVFVCPYLIGLTLTDLKSPLSLFQATEATKDDTLKLVLTLNKALGDQARKEASVEQVFDKWWPDLESKLNEATQFVPPKEHRRSDRELLEEILLLVRNTTQVVNLTPQDLSRQWDELSRERFGKALLGYLSNPDSLQQYGNLVALAKATTPSSGKFYPARKMTKPPEPK